MISLGFVVAKFGVWLRELAKRLAPQMPMKDEPAPAKTRFLVAFLSYPFILNQSLTGCFVEEKSYGYYSGI